MSFQLWPLLLEELFRLQLGWKNVHSISAADASEEDLKEILPNFRLTHLNFQNHSSDLTCQSPQSSLSHVHTRIQVHNIGTEYQGYIL